MKHKTKSSLKMSIAGVFLLMTASSIMFSCKKTAVQQAYVQKGVVVTPGNILSLIHI